jgi:hypothetical protein
MRRSEVLLLFLAGLLVCPVATPHDHEQRLKAGKCDVISERVAWSMNWIGPCRNRLAHGSGVMIMDKTQVHKQTYVRGKLVGNATEIVGTTGEGAYFHLSCVKPCEGARARAINESELPDWARPFLPIPK